MEVVLRKIDRRMAHLRASGYVLRWHHSLNLDADRLILDCELINGLRQTYYLTALEVVGRSLFDWLDTVERDIVYRCRQYRMEDPPVYVEAIPDRGENSFYREYLQDWAQRGWTQASDEQAEARAAELFMLVCGKEAFDTLNAKKPLPITGSKGTQYTLHKRSTYCVERASDHTKLCAVVPGVPLWDHLLGIKLMIEHDEPKFLETANVAHSTPMDIAFAENIQRNNSLLRRLRNLRY